MYYIFSQLGDYLMKAQYRLPIAMIMIFFFVFVLGGITPIYLKQFFYSVSLLIKEVIVFLLPAMIFSFLFFSLISLKEKAFLFIVLLLTTVAASNFTAIMTGYSVGITTLPFIHPNLSDGNIETVKLTPLWSLNIPRIITNEPAMILGILTGLFFALRPNKKAEKFAAKMNNACVSFLRKFFLPILPLFILGFVFKLEHEKLLDQVLGTYSPVLFVVVCAQVGYITLLYMLASGFKIKTFLRYIENILPATITGFSTISSAATLPVTMIASERNLNNAKFARMITPATCNIHTLGSALGLTILSLATIMAFNKPLPELSSFLQFAAYYTLAKFAVAGIPGGVVIVVTPLLEAYLGFTPDMIGLITALYLLFDPFGTATNVTCNGAFALLFSKIYKQNEKEFENAEEVRVKTALR